jgi:hypothetical protein
METTIYTLLSNPLQHKITSAGNINRHSMTSSMTMKPILVISDFIFVHAILILERHIECNQLSNI